MVEQEPRDKDRGPGPRLLRRSNSPIISEQPWRGYLPSLKTHVAAVVVYAKGDRDVIWPSARQRIHLSRRPATVYEVDLGHHQAVVEADVRSSTEACAFHAHITIRWYVADPARVVDHRIADTAAMLKPQVLKQVRAITQDYSIIQVSAAEEQLNKQLDWAPADIAHGSEPQNEADHIGAEYGLRVRCITHLTLDAAAAEHSSKMAHILWDIEQEKAEQKLRRLQEKNKRKLTKRRMRMYQEIIASGDINRFALQLADNPGDIAAIEKIIREEQRISRRDTIDFISRMVESGVVERWQISEEVKQALNWLRDATSRIIPERPSDPETQHPGRRQKRSTLPTNASPEMKQPSSDTALSHNGPVLGGQQPEEPKEPKEPEEP